MRALLFSLILACSSAFGQWVEGTTIGVRADNSKMPNFVFVNTYSGHGPQENAWVRVPVKDLGVPEDALSVFLSGILVITHGYTFQTCDVVVSLRAPGDTMDAGNFIGQAIEAAIGSGQRSNMSTWAPVRDGHVEFLWWRSTRGQWPQECAYGINLSAQAYVR